MLISGQAIENTARIYQAAGDGEAMNKLFNPTQLTEQMLKDLEEFAGKEFKIDGRA